MTTNGFLPDGYSVPSATDKYMKLKPGENKFRILSAPILGWEYWIDTPEGGRKPLRKPLDKPFNQDEADDPEKIKQFWAMVVWNYQEKKIQILEVTQRGIQKNLETLSRDEDWGSPVQKYDLVITRAGEDLNTKYEVFPKPAKALDTVILNEYKEMNINLNALYAGEDPFASEEEIDMDEVEKALS